LYEAVLLPSTVAWHASGICAGKRCYIAIFTPRITSHQILF
jgi:hypothetical protein